MFKKLAFLACLILGMGLIAASTGNAADPALVGWWRLDETSGTIARDSSGNGNDGTLQGDPTWVVGKMAGALEFDGDGDYVDIGGVGISGVAPRTIAGWAKASTTNIPGWTTVFGFAPSGSTDGTYYDIEVDDAGNYVINVQGWAGIFGPVDTQWHHFAVTYTGDGGDWYLDGQYVNSEAGEVGTIDYMRIGARLSNSNFFPGLVDDVRIYNKVLTIEQIQQLMAGPKANNPDPADGAFYEDAWVSLGWLPGEAAVSHDVYFGDNFDDVNDGADEAFKGNQAETYFIVGSPGSPSPDALVPGTAYYWRIDEVEADGTTKHRGDIWSFLIPSKIAYNPDPPDGAGFVDPNVTIGWTPGLDAKLHFVYFGDSFDDVNNAAGGPPHGFATYTPGPLELEKVYYWRVDEFDAVATHKGDVWSFTTPGAVGNPHPSNGAVSVGINVIPGWTPADHAASHQVYFGTDKDAVRNADAGSADYKGPKALGAESYDPGLLERDTTYYWRVDEVNDLNPNSPWKGPLWSFTTGDFLVVDDFESYNDLDPDQPGSNRIFDKWIDGFGTTTNGALVGHDLPPYAEQTIVHGGGQSMPYRYDNNLKTSEATFTLVYPRDWAEQGVTKLVLWFRGESGNAAERMYVALDGNAVVYHNDQNAAQTTVWTEWIIDLQEFADQGVDLTNVNTITIGLGTKNSPAAGGAGRMYFDDIRLSR
ncbi:MAG: LamG domain-containing protein [Planctomycetota bacterium]|jgi:hypothetical protein